MNSLVRLVAVAIVTMQSSASADPIDLKAGLGKFTWAMKRDALMKEAKT